MAQFNEKEHLQNVTLLAEELSKILKNSMIIVGKEFREIGDLTAMAKDTPHLHLFTFIRLLTTVLKLK